MPLPDDGGAGLAEALQRPLRSRARPDEEWLYLWTWKPQQVEADLTAAAGGELVGRLVPEPDNEADPRAVVVVCSAGPMGYVSAWEAAHLSRALLLLDGPPEVRLRRTRRRTSPLHDVLLPELHQENRHCGVCDQLQAESRAHRYGSLTS